MTRSGRHLHDLVEVLHVLPGHGLYVLPTETVLHQQLIELLDLVARRERSNEMYY